MIKYIAFVIIAIIAILITCAFIIICKEENESINNTIKYDLKDWSSLQCWNYMQEHKNDKFSTEYDRIKFLACKKIIDKRMR